MDYVREHLDADSVNAVVQVHSHHRGDAAYSAAGLLLHFGSKGYTGFVGFRDAEADNESDNSSGDAPFDYEGTAFPEFGDELHDVDFALFFVVWLVGWIFLHLFLVWDARSDRA